MTNFNYFKADRIYNELYYQFPKVFLVSEKYRKMSDSTKIAYMLLKARLQMAVAKKQIDEKGNVYFTFTSTELCRVLNCQKQKAIQIKKNLETYGLLLQKDMGFNKKKGQYNANRLYLAELEVDENDIYLIEKMESNDSQEQSMKITPCASKNNEARSIDVQEGMKIIPSKNVDKSEGMKIIQEFNNNNNLDTNRHLIDTEVDQLQDQLLLNEFETIMQESSIGTFVPERVLGLIKTFSSSYEEAQQTVKTIHNAKAKAEKEMNTIVVFEEIDSYGINAEQALYTTLLKAYQKQRTEKVQNIQNLIFVYVKNWFIEHPIAAKKQQDTQKSNEPVLMTNWLNE